jgi:NAD(P)H-dependent FMN reductase
LGRLNLTVNVLAISGSLRTQASNTAILEAACRIAPPSIHVTLYPGVGALPHFNPDLDRDDGAGLPTEVARLREQVGDADALLISTPEYAHGLPGAFKNALDWLVGSTSFPGKAVAVINVSPRSVHAHAQLREILTTMSARLLDDASRTIPLPRRDIDAEAIAQDGELAALVRSVLDAIALAVESEPPRHS